MTDSRGSQFGPLDFDLVVRRASGEVLATMSDARWSWTCVDLIKALPEAPARYVYEILLGEDELPGMTSLRQVGLTSESSQLTAILKPNPSELALHDSAKDLVDFMSNISPVLFNGDGRIPYAAKVTLLETLPMLLALDGITAEADADGLKVDPDSGLDAARSSILKDIDSFEAFVTKHTQFILDAELDHSVVLALLATHDLGLRRVRRVGAEEVRSGAWNFLGDVILAWLFAIDSYCCASLGKSFSRHFPPHDDQPLAEFFKSLLTRGQQNASNYSRS